MLSYNPPLIIKQLQPSVDFAVANRWEIFLQYRKHKALTYYIE